LPWPYASALCLLAFAMCCMPFAFCLLPFALSCLPCPLCCLRVSDLPTPVTFLTTCNDADQQLLHSSL